MAGFRFRLAPVVLFAAALAGCATSPEVRPSSGPERPSYGANVVTPDAPNQCVPYARARSGVALYGDANTWWVKAAGHYARSTDPLLGSVMVLTGYANDGRSHLGVVTQLVSDREIRIDHANWLNDGKIYLSDPVADVSAGNDWTAVRVWNPHTRAWGQRIYLVEGFIGPGQDGADRVASAEPAY
jgi:surface antigen